MDIPARIIMATIQAVPAVMPHLAPGTLEAIKAAAGYEGIRLVFRSAVFGSVFGYLSGGDWAASRDRMIAALAQAYTDTVDIAYVEGGGELPIDDETATWARGQIEAQFGFIDGLFDDLREIRREGNTDVGAYANARADSYTSALDGFYNAAVMMGTKNKMLTWILGAAEKHCKDCAKLNGQRHKASWYISRGYFPGKPGSATECGGWNCQCYLIDDKGNEITI